MDCSIESWGIRSAPEGTVLALLWSGELIWYQEPTPNHWRKQGLQRKRKDLDTTMEAQETLLGIVFFSQDLRWHGTRTQAHASSGGPLVGSPCCLVLCVARHGLCLDWCQLFLTLGHLAKEAKGG